MSIISVPGQTDWLTILIIIGVAGITAICQQIGIQLIVIGNSRAIINKIKIKKQK